MDSANAKVLQTASRRFALTSWILSAGVWSGVLGLQFFSPAWIASLGAFAVTYLMTTSVARALTFSGLYVVLGLLR